MVRSQVRSRTGCLFVALCTVACSGGYESSSPETETEASPIYAGVELSQSELDASGLVAVYHPHPPEFPDFYPRPCSGVIVRSSGGLSMVLTARHCVTTDGDDDGPLVNAFQLRLSRTLRPLAAPPGPPPDAVTPTFIFDKMGARMDIAAVFVVADWQAVADQRMGLYVGDPRSLQSQRFTAYGYGINEYDAGCGVTHSTFGAGIARSGSDFTVTTGRIFFGGQPASYEYSPISTNGQVTMCGDSGGPDELINGAGRLLLGVHSSGVSLDIDSTSTPFDFSMQELLGGLYLGNRMANPDSMLGENPSTHNVQMVARDSEQRTTVTYDVPTKRIQMNGRCLSAVSGFIIPPPAWLAACNASDPAQMWTVYPNGQIANPRTGKCLTNGSSGVALGACVLTLNGRPIRPSATMWSFRAQL